MSNDLKNREKESKKVTAKKTTKKTDTKEATISKEEKAAEAKDLCTRQFIGRVKNMIQEFLEEFQINENLTSLDRRRLTGAGVRREQERRSSHRGAKAQK